MGLPHSLICVWLTLAVSASWAAGGLSAKELGVDAAKIKAALEGLERRLEKDTMAEGDVGNAIKEVTGLRTRSNQCFTSLEPELARLRESQKAMGEPTAEEKKDLRGERRALVKEQAVLQSQVTECRVLARRADALVDRLTGLQNALLTARLLHRDLSLRELILAMLRDPGQWWTGSQRVIDEFSGLQSLTPKALWRMAIIGALALAFGIWVNGSLHRYQNGVDRGRPFARVQSALAASLAHYAPCLLLCGALATQLAVQFRDLSSPPFVALFFLRTGRICGGPDPHSNRIVSARPSGTAHAPARPARAAFGKAADGARVPGFHGLFALYDPALATPAGDGFCACQGNFHGFSGHQRSVANLDCGRDSSVEGKWKKTSFAIAAFVGGHSRCGMARLPQSRHLFIPRPNRYIGRPAGVFDGAERFGCAFRWT